MGKIVSPDFHGKKGKSGRKTKKEELKAYLTAQNLFFDEQDQEQIEAKIRSGRFSIADRFKLTAMEGDSRILAKAADKALPNAGEEDKSADLVINIVQFNADDTNTAQLRPVKKTISIRNSEEPSEIQVADFTQKSGEDSLSS